MRSVKGKNMSKAAKQGILVLMVLLAMALGFSGVSLIGKQKIEQEKIAVQKDLQKSQSQSQGQVVEIDSLKQQIAKEQSEKESLQKSVREKEEAINGMQKRMEELLAQVGTITEERDTWKRRLDNIKKERDELLVKLQEKPKEKIVYKYLEKGPEALRKQDEPVRAAEIPVSTPQPETAAKDAEAPLEGAPTDEEDHLAQLLKQKASLELKIDELNAELSKRSLEIIELKQSHESLKIEFDTVRYAKETIEKEIRHKEDLINNLSLELAWAKNDNRFIAQKADHSNKQNLDLLQHIKRLTSTKGALEKSIIRLTQEKDEVQKKLGQTESLVQNKIDEIWEIKESLDMSFRMAQGKPAAGEVELSPIVVSAQGPEAAVKTDPKISKPGFEGKIVSVNEENNFIIVDVGEKRGVRLGDVLGVYRGSEYIARVEVIQVRQDISAADLKDQWSKVKAGDVVR
jgi:predicted  nucleic acid-binding Zn-ribbon protein